MFASFSEFKYFQSFRIPVESRDDVRFMIEYEDDLGKYHYIEDAKLSDASVTGLGYVSGQRISVMTNLRVSIQFKRLRIDLDGHIVRAFGYQDAEDKMLYGIEIDEEDGRAKVFLKPDQVSLAIGKGGHNIKLGGRLTGYELDVYREGAEDIDDVDLDEFTDEIDDWIIDELKAIGCDSAKSVLEIGKTDLVKRTDLEEETIDEIIKILSSEFEK